MHAYLVDHHDGKQVEQSGKEQAIHIMCHIVADCLAEDVEDDLSDNQRTHAESDMPERPSLL